MELQQLIEKWTKEMADIKQHIKEHEDTFGHPAATSRERYEAISDMLADVKQLNLPPVSKAKRTCPHCGSTKIIMFTADLDLCQNCNAQLDGA